MAQQYKKTICPVCKEVHMHCTQTTILPCIMEDITFSYQAEYEYCSKLDEYYETPEQKTRNDIAKKRAFRDMHNMLEGAARLQ